MATTEEKVRAICAEVAAPDPDIEKSPGSRLPEDLGRMRELAVRIAAAQRTPLPQAGTKGMAFFVADHTEGAAMSDAVETFFTHANPIHSLSQQQAVKLAVVDAGLKRDFASAAFAGQLMRQRLPVSVTDPESKVWESLHAGVRTAFMMKGRGTDIFGLGFLNDDFHDHLGLDAIAAMGTWDLGAATGFILAAANLQTPVVISGVGCCLAAGLALTLAPQALDYLLLAQPGEIRGGEEIQPLFELKMPHSLAVLLGLGLCESAVRVCRAIIPE